MGLAKKFLTVSSLTVISRIFGVFREMLLVHFLGASIEMDAFTTAFKFPSFFRRFFAEGGFQSIFVPYFTDFTTSNKLKGASYFSSRLFSLIFWVMLIITILVEVFAEEFTVFMAPGFAATPEKFKLTVEFTRIIFPSVAFVALSTIYSGTLISKQKFFIFSLAPILVNFVLIASLFIGKDIFSAGKRISYGVLAAGIFQLVYMYCCVKYQRFPSPKLSSVRLSGKVKGLLKKLGPVLAGAGVAQVNVLVSSFFASFLPTGCVTYIYCADRFIQLPLALFGISMGIILLPEISESIARGKKDNIQSIQSKSIIFTLKLTMPSVCGLIAISYYITSLLYGHGKFDELAVQHTADVLKVAALGLPAFVMAKIMASVLFAQKDTKSPMNAAIISIIVNVVFSFIFIKPLHEIGLALASTIAGFANVFVMCYQAKGSFKFEKTLVINLIKITISSAVMLLILCLIINYLSPTTKLDETILVVISGIVGIILYIAFLALLKDQGALSCIGFISNKFKIK